MQIITSGTDRKVAYWEVFDGSQIRELEASKSGSINGVDLSPGGKRLVTGGDDRLIKVRHSAISYDTCMIAYAKNSYSVIRI